MRRNFLIMAHQFPIPDIIKVEEDWGPLTIMNESGLMVSGTHVLLDGDDEDMGDWLGEYDEIWVGIGITPQLEQFKSYTKMQEEDNTWEKKKI